MRFRAHHILCANLYRGLGYDDAFCGNMTEKVRWLREDPSVRLTLVAKPDDICAGCPNLRDERFCTNGDNHVEEKDRRLMAALHLRENTEYTYRQLNGHAKKYLTAELFAESCKSCGWFRAGVCRFEDFRF